jgi:hypothetical protein
MEDEWTTSIGGEAPQSTFECEEGGARPPRERRERERKIGTTEIA